MAKQFNIPQAPTTYTYTFTDFLGVDYNNPFDSDIRHSPKMLNMILENGYLKKRHGLKIKLFIDNARIHGIWNYDIPSDDDFDEIFIVHCGTNLYEVDKNFTTKALVMSNLADVDSYGMFLGDKLVILDGKRAIVYGKYNNVYGPQYMDTVAYIPTTTIGLSPSGLNGTAYESANNLTQFRINEFLSDGESAVYKTDSYALSTNPSDTKIWILNNDTGFWDLVDSSKYTVETDNKITFNTPPPAPVVVGRDNVRIQFKSTTWDHANLINKCRFCVPFGYQGNNQRLFFSGNPEQPNVDWHSDLVASQPDPTYVPDDSFAVIGSQPIVGYLRLSDGTLAILKGLSDTDCSIYYRTSNAQGRWDIFPLLSGTKNVGCLTNYCCCNVQNNAIFLGELGVYQAVTGEASSTLERYADNKSYYINKKLLKETNLENAKAVSVGSLYYLFVNTKLYICDTSKLTQPKNSNINQYQWWPCELHVNISATCRWNNKLILGDNAGYIKMFGDDYIDELGIINNEYVSQDVDCYFETVPFDFSQSSSLRSNIAKTTRNFVLNYIAPETSKFEFGYRTIDEEKVDSEEIYKIIDKSFDDSDLRDFVYLPYGTKLEFDKSCSYTSSGDGYSGYLYGTQTDTIKTYFGFYITNGTLYFGTFSIDITDPENYKVEMLKEIYNSNDGYKLNSMIIKKKLDLLHSIKDVLPITSPSITASKNNGILIVNPTLNEIPQTIRVKEKARKVMFLKFYVESKKYACEFDRIFIDFRNAGKYRGE